jgi:uncharacterized protein (DUF1810 family)
MSTPVRNLRKVQKDRVACGLSSRRLEGLGYSAMARKFPTSSRPEAQELLNHPILGPGLRLCTELVNLVKERSFDEIFGHPDNRQFHASMTLFSRVTNYNQMFVDALDKYFEANCMGLTLACL